MQLFLRRMLSAWALAVPAVAAAHVEIKTSSGVPAHWAGNKATYVINITGSDDITGDASEDQAIRLGFKQWSDFSGAALTLTEDAAPNQRARTDWESSDIHMILFDESNSSGFFPSGTGIIAITPLKFSSSSGAMIDADILFNGTLGSPFSTSLTPGSFDVWSTATHEIGHFIGLDHSPIGAATMAPFQSPQEFTPRTIGPDDAAGARFLYPSTAKGKISGQVKRASDNSAVSGAGVWARSTADGRVYTGTTSDASGNFTITGLDPDTYRVSAGPLDGPVSSANFSSHSVSTIQIDFQPASSAPVAVIGTQTTSGVSISVGPDSNMNISGPGVPRTIRAGESKGLTLSGTGLAGGTVTVPDSGNAFTIIGTAPSFTLSASAQAVPGVYDLWVVGTGGDAADLPGFIEVLPAAPSLSSVDPNAGSSDGGTLLAVHGGNLTNTITLLFGDAAGVGYSVTNSALGAVTTPAHSAGSVAVTAVDAAGAEARISNGYQFVAAEDPKISSVFPAFGAAAGGTHVKIAGSGFVSNTTATFGGAALTSVVVTGDSLLEGVTPALAAGTYDVVVTNPGPPAVHATAAGAFTTTAQTDPSATSAGPPLVSALGGATVTIDGSGFVNGATVRFFANAASGAGGTAVTPVEFVSSTQLKVTAPAGALGPASIVVTNPSGQASILAQAVTYTAQFSGAGSLAGAIATPSETDRALFDGVAGTKVNINIAPAAKSTLLARLEIADAGGTVVLSTDSASPAFAAGVGSEAGAKAAIKNFVLPSTQRYELRVTGHGGTSGKYKCIFKETLPASALKVSFTGKPPTSVGPGTASRSFDAKPGSKLGGKLTSKPPLLAMISVFDGPAGSLLGVSAVTSTMTSLSGGKILQFTATPLTALGTYQITVSAASATSGTLSGVLTVTPPKLAKTAFVE